MQVDFHLAVVYALSRLAGFSPAEANTIASSSQYVDDAVHDGELEFTNRARYQFVASAHRMLDYRNLGDLANSRVWIPFHFLPGNDYDPSVAAPEFVQRLVCRPDSVVAREIVASCLEQHDHAHSLHLLGVTLHVYADTWAHQGFLGLSHEMNRVHEIFDSAGELDLAMLKYRDQFFGTGKFAPWWKRTWNRLKTWFINFEPVGHGPVLSYPDLPYLKWQYRDWRGEVIIRDNPKDYMAAVDALYRVLCDFLRKTGHEPRAFKSQDRDAIEKLLRENCDEEPVSRLRGWENSLRKGLLSYGTDVWTYVDSGVGSWGHQAFGYQSDEQFVKSGIEFKKEFLRSDWKYLHDALLAHRFAVISGVLGKQGICVA